MTKKRLLFILTLLLLITTGSTSVHTVFENKIVETSAENKTDSTNTECHNCNLLKEDDLIFIELKKNRRSKSSAKQNVDSLMKLFKSMSLDLYSDKNIFTYVDASGKYKNLTIREYNEIVLYNINNPDSLFKIIPGVTTIEAGYKDILNKLIVQKRHGIVDGYNDITLQKLRESKYISKALPLCSYSKYGPIGMYNTLYVTGVSAEDEKEIFKKNKLNLLCRSGVCTYEINDLSRKKMVKLLQVLCKSTTVTSVQFDYTFTPINH